MHLHLFHPRTLREWEAGDGVAAAVLPHTMPIHFPGVAKGPETPPVATFTKFIRFCNAQANR